jgi:hypothetical protein
MGSDENGERGAHGDSRHTQSTQQVGTASRETANEEEARAPLLSASLPTTLSTADLANDSSASARTAGDTRSQNEEGSRAADGVDADRWQGKRAKRGTEWNGPVCWL